MKTKYDPENGLFSDKAHLAARDLIYPALFKVSPDKLEFENTLLYSSSRNTMFDGDLAIDRIVRVSNLNFRQPLEFKVQERFRRMEYSDYKDITLTEWNNLTDRPSELYKISATLMVYAFYDKDRQVFIDPIVLDVPRLLMGLAMGEVPFVRRTNSKQQSFICIKYEHLLRNGLYVWYSPKVSKQSYAVSVA